MSFQIVPMAGDADMDAKAYVHWKAWQEAYAGLVDAAFLEKFTLDRCREMARRWPDNILLAKNDEGRVIGFVGYGKSGDENLTSAGEVFAIYVLREYYGQKAGYQLMNAGLEKLNAYSKTIVWVLEGNTSAIRFYERYGFVRDGAKKDIVLGTPISEIWLVYERRS